MTIYAALVDITRAREKIQEHEEAIKHLIRHSLSVANCVNLDLIEIADQRYEYSNGLHFMDEGKSDVDLSSRIDAVDHCINALGETHNRMRTIRDYLDEEGEF